MTPPISLRQIETFKALMEHGTVRRAAEVAVISEQRGDTARLITVAAHTADAATTLG